MYNRQVLVTTIKDLIKELEKYDENMDVYVIGCEGYLYIDEEDGCCSFDDSPYVISESDEYFDEVYENYDFRQVEIGDKVYDLPTLLNEDGEFVIDKEDEFAVTFPKSI